MKFKFRAYDKKEKRYIGEDPNIPEYRDLMIGLDGKPYWIDGCWEKDIYEAKEIELELKLIK
jgi:hypothetical protein